MADKRLPKHLRPDEGADENGQILIHTVPSGEAGDPYDQAYQGFSELESNRQTSWEWTPEVDYKFRKDHIGDDERQEREFRASQAKRRSVATQPEDSTPYAEDDGEGFPQYEVPPGTVAEVLEWVGDDVGKAQAALNAEFQQDRQRRTLVDALEEVISTE